MLGHSKYALLKILIVLLLSFELFLRRFNFNYRSFFVSEFPFDENIIMDNTIFSGHFVPISVESTIE